MHARDEQVLRGGNLTRVVRVGDTVRRDAGPWTAMVHDLLRHVRAAGFTMAPEPLGIDEQGREVLAFLPGETLTGEPWPPWVWSDELLADAARALARYHRAVAGFRPDVVRSRLGTTVLGPDDIVCHNDFAPYNSTFAAGSLRGVFDWDVVQAAPPVWDIAFVAWQWIPLRAPAEHLVAPSAAAAARRLRLLVDAYELHDASDLVDVVLSRIDASRSGIVERAAAGDEVFRGLERDGHARAMAAAIAFVRSIERPLRQALAHR